MTQKTVVILTSYSKSIVIFKGHLIRSLVNSGCSVTILGPSFTPDIIFQLHALGASVSQINFSRTSSNLLRDTIEFLTLYLRFLRLSPDVVLTYFLKPNIFGIFAAFLAFVPMRVCMVEGLGHFFTPSPSNKFSFKKYFLSELILLLYAFIFKLSHVIVTLNSDDRALLVDRCGLTDSKTLPLRGIGVSLDEWPSHAPFTSPLTFTFVGRLLVDKGIVEYLNAARLVKSNHPSVRFLLLGDFDDNPSSIDLRYLQPFIDDGTITWLAFASPLFYYRQTSVFVLPSYREGCPRTVQEAMSCGLPIITTNVPGCRETVLNGKNGFLVEPFSSDSLVNAILTFIHNPSLIYLMGLESRTLALRWYDVELINKLILSRILR